MVIVLSLMLRNVSVTVFSYTRHMLYPFIYLQMQFRRVYKQDHSPELNLKDLKVKEPRSFIALAEIRHVPDCLHKSENMSVCRIPNQ